MSAGQLSAGLRNAVKGLARRAGLWRLDAWAWDRKALKTPRGQRGR